MCDLIVSVPDHCLSFYFSMSFKSSYIRETVQNRNKKIPATYKWNKVSSEKFKHALRDKDLSSKIKSFLKHDIQETGIDHACDMFEDIILDAAKRYLTTKNSKKVKDERQ